jgi:hypothetical protein
MTTYQNALFAQQNVIVDGNRYVGCTFSNCGLVYDGGELPVFDRCTFQGISVQLGGSALTTVRYLSGLHQGGLAKPVEALLNRIETGPVDKSQPKPRYNLEAVGSNWGQLGAISLLLFGVTALLLAALHYGMNVYPRQVLESEETRPLTTQLAYDLMPSHPDELVSAYDSKRQAQLDQIGTYGWVDQTQQVAHIPVETAMDLLLENDGFPAAGE